MTTILISYVCGSDQFMENTMDHFFDIIDFDQIKKNVRQTLENANLYRKDNYWAYFRVWQDGKWIETDEIFKHRIKI